MNVEQIARAALWGEAFELSVKRGVLQYLVDRSLIDPQDPAFAPWRSHTNAHLNRRMIESFKSVDANLKQWLSSMTRHLSVLGYGLGWSAMRECLRASNVGEGKVEAIWCPFLLPGESPRDAEMETARAFQDAFKLPGRLDMGLLNRGMPGRADFILWLSLPRSQHQIVCLEFSYNAPLQLADYTQEKAHRDEVARYARYMEARGVFARVCTELEGSFELAPRLEKHLYAFSSSDKPLFKLCQASSYSEQLLTLLKSRGRMAGDCTLRAIAVTSYGCESIAARCTSLDPEPETLKLMKSLGKAYREALKPQSDCPEALQGEIEAVFHLLLRSLPAPLKAQIREIFPLPNLRQPLNFRFQEEVTEFFRPTSLMDLDAVVAAVEETEALKDYCLGDFSSAFRHQLEIVPKSSLDLRGVHRAAAIASLECAQTGKLNVIALEGNPGIGKTTALIDFLKQQSSFLFFYLSPRVAINREVASKLSRDGDKATGIATIATNADLIAAAPEWCQKNAVARKIDSGVVIDGVEDLARPKQSIFFFSPSQEAEIEERALGSNQQKSSISDREDKLSRIQRPGVLRTLSTSARQILQSNPQLARLVLTGAIQGYRSLNDGTTVRALDNLFQNKPDAKAGINERRQFARRIDTVVVMVDELAGDGAGSPLIHELAKWLEVNFLKYFNGDSPFKVILILADASLSNEVVFSSFLAGGYSAPDKVLISESRGKSPFRLTANCIQLGQKKYPTVHIMTNSYPASRLDVEYSVRLTPVTPKIESNGRKQALRRAIKDVLGEELLENACQEIKNGWDSGAEQIIFFAQDKAFLREVRERLIEKEILEESLIAVLDQSTPPKEKMALIQESVRDRVGVFLMTSSGARGISFPRTSWIIASIPRFNLETALMEVAQLIYRGRGTYVDPETGAKVSGDEKERKLVMLIQDFIAVDEDIDPQRAWLRQSSDLLTLLMMLRATILTRITGDARLNQKSLSFVPVGAIGDEDLLDLMSADLQSFLTEAKVFIRERKVLENKGIVVEAEALVSEIFPTFDLVGKAISRQVRSYTDPKSLEALVKVVSRLNSSFLLDKVAEIAIPDNIRCLGPFWVEDWSDREIEEKFTFEGWRERHRVSISRLLGLLGRISEGSFPTKLKRTSKSVRKFLVREKERSAIEYSTFQDIKASKLVLSLPLDYPHWYRETEEFKTEIEDPLTWSNSLGRTLTRQGLSMPVLARYQSYPWSAVAGAKVLDGLEILFSDRYFLASSELNLLNLILL